MAVNCQKVAAYDRTGSEACSIPIVVETVTEVEAVPEVNDVPDEQAESSPSEDDSQSKDSAAEIIFADNVNNAVALLTGNEQSVQMGLDALQNLDKDNEESAEVPYNIGVAQLKLENERAAQKAFERAIEIDPFQPYGHQLLARIDQFRRGKNR